MNKDVFSESYGLNMDLEYGLNTDGCEPIVTAANNCACYCSNNGSSFATKHQTLENLLLVASYAAEHTQGSLPATGSSLLDRLHDRTPPSEVV
jgi:hypothetical protein